MLENVMKILKKSSNLVEFDTFFLIFLFQERYC